MEIAGKLERAAVAAAVYGAVSAVLASEPAGGGRGYLVALGEEPSRSWIVLDAELQPVSERERVREVAAIVVLCELAVELAAGGELGELRARLAELEALERAQGLDAARAAAAELERVIGSPPRLASPAYLDRVGAATRGLERELGEHASPLASALAAHTGTVEAFVAEVEGRNRLALR